MRALARLSRARAAPLAPVRPSEGVAIDPDKRTIPFEIVKALSKVRPAEIRSEK